MTWVWLRGLARETGHWGGLPRQAEEALGERVITIDLPGFGRNSDINCPTDIREMVSFLIASTQGLKSINILAVSLGGLIALNWASADGRVASVTAVNSSSRLNRFNQRIRLSKALSLLRLFIGSEDEQVREEKILSIVSNCEQKSKQVLSLWSEITRRRPIQFNQVLRQLYLAATAPIINPELLRNCRLTFLASNCDQLVSPLCSHSLASYYQGRLLVHPTAGHDLPLDDPQWLLGQLQPKAFLSKPSSADC
jgi:pimeloyl-ACP methyl ester carboxylesterase